MKKSIILTILFSIGTLAFIACSGGGSGSGESNNASFTGKYIVTDMVNPEKDITFKDVIELMDAQGWKLEDKAFVEFMVGGKFKLVLYTDETQGTYKRNGKILNFTNNDDETFEMTIVGDKLVWTLGDDSKVVFEKK